VRGSGSERKHRWRNGRGRASGRKNFRTGTPRPARMSRQANSRAASTCVRLLYSDAVDWRRETAFPPGAPIVSTSWSQRAEHGFGGFAAAPISPADQPVIRLHFHDGSHEAAQWQPLRAQRRFQRNRHRGGSNVANLHRRYATTLQHPYSLTLQLNLICAEGTVFRASFDLLELAMASFSPRPTGNLFARRLERDQALCGWRHQSTGGARHP